MKRKDIHGSYGCSSCHDAVDGRSKVNLLTVDLKLAHYEGMVRTQEIMIIDGVLKL